MFQFNESSGVFDSALQILNITVNVMWYRPVNINGPNVTYILDIRRRDDDDHVLTTDLSEESVLSSVLVQPFQSYRVSVVATNEVGNSTVTSIVERSPEAGGWGKLGVSLLKKNLNI